MPQQSATASGRPVSRLRAVLLCVLLGLMVACAALLLHATPGSGVGTGHDTRTTATSTTGTSTRHAPESAPEAASASTAVAGQDCTDCATEHHLGLAVACLVAVVLLALVLPARPRGILLRAGRETRAGPPAGVVRLTIPRPPDLAELCILRT